MSPIRSNYEATLRYLYGLQTRGIKYGLANIRALLSACGHPEQRFISIHVAGTNGKGSTCSFIASMLQEAGYRTGLYTSPHLERFTERIRIDGVEIPEYRLVDYARDMHGVFEKVRATFFEATTCIAFRYFADEGIEVGVIETGLGGRLDATNVLAPLASVITNIALDHAEYLGTTIRSIAREKAGIIKRGMPVVTASTSVEALAVLRTVARKRGSPFHHMWEIVDARTIEVRKGAALVQLRGSGWRIPRLRLGHPGEHQVQNAALAVSALALAARSGELRRLTGASIARGLRKVVVNTGLGGRMQRVSFGGVTITLDVAHNPDGMRALADSVSAAGVVFPLAVFGIVQDKDAGGVLEELRRVAKEIIAVSPATERGREGRETARMATERGILAVDGGSVTHGLASALRRLESDFPPSKRWLLVAGSHYVVGEALEYLKGRQKQKKP